MDHLYDVVILQHTSASWCVVCIDILPSEAFLHLKEKIDSFIGLNTTRIMYVVLTLVATSSGVRRTMPRPFLLSRRA
jgi:hypothetical protein